MYHTSWFQREAKQIIFKKKLHDGFFELLKNEVWRGFSSQQRDEAFLTGPSFSRLFRSYGVPTRFVFWRTEKCKSQEAGPGTSCLMLLAVVGLLLLAR